MFLILKEYQTLFSALIVAIGWFVNQSMNRKNERLKRQAECRIRMLNAVIEFRNDFVRNKTFNQVLYDNAYLEMQLYGNSIEIQTYDAFIEKLARDRKNGNLVAEDTEESLVKLVLLCRDGIRDELDLETLPRQTIQ